jgi:hypothetical protein
MAAIRQNQRSTRRGFLGLGSAALATAGLLADAHPAKASPKAGEKTDPAQPELTRVAGKIALEEHFATPETIEASTVATHSPEFSRQIPDMGSGRIAERWTAVVSNSASSRS